VTQHPSQLNPSDQHLWFHSN